MKKVLLAALMFCGLVAHVPVHGGVEDLGGFIRALSFVEKVGKVASVAVPVIIVGTIVRCVIKARARINNMNVETEEATISNDAEVSPGLNNEDFKQKLDALLAKRPKKKVASKK